MKKKTEEGSEGQPVTGSSASSVCDPSDDKSGDSASKVPARSGHLRCQISLGACKGREERANER